MTFCPRPCTVAISEMNCAVVYPPVIQDDRPESRLKSTAPGVVVALAKATAMMSYVVGTSLMRRHLAPLLKSCQYPISKCFGSPPPPGVGAGVGLGVGVGLGL